MIFKSFQRKIINTFFQFSSRPIYSINYSKTKKNPLFKKDESNGDGGIKNSSLQKIISQCTKSKDFWKCFGQNKQQFKSSLLVLASFKLIKLNHHKQHNQKIQEFLKILSKQNFNDYEENDNLIFLRLLKITMKNNSFKDILNEIKNKIFMSLFDIIRQKNYGAQKLDYLCQLYRQLAFWDDSICRIIVEKIMIIFEKNKRDDSIWDVKMPEIYRIMRLRDNLTFQQKQFRKALIQNFQKDYLKKPIKVILNVCIVLNNMVQHDLIFYQRKMMVMVNKLIQTKITSLEKQDIQLICQKAKLSKNRFYQHILKSVFLKILRDKEQGLYDARQSFILFVQLSFRIKLYLLHQPDQKLFFKILEEVKNQSKTDRQKKKVFLAYFSQLVKNQFFSSKDFQKVFEVLEGLQDEMTINFHFLMTIKAYKYTINAFENLKKCCDNDVFKTKNGKFKAIKLFIAIKKQQMLNKSQNTDIHLESIEKIISSHFTNQQNFIQFTKYFLQNEVFAPNTNLYQVFHHHFDKMKNPFLEECNNESYRFYYMIFYCKGNFFSQIVKFIKNNHHKITINNLVGIITNQMNSEYLNNNLTLICVIANEKFEKIIESKNPSTVNLLLKFLSKIHEYVIQSNHTISDKPLIFLLMNKIIRNYKHIANKSSKQFIEVMEKYMQSRNFNFAVDETYRYFIRQLLSIINDIPKKEFIRNKIITYAVNLNIVTKEHVLSLVGQLELFKNGFQVQKRKYLLDENYKQINPQISNYNIMSLFSNHNYAQILNNNQKKVFAIIQECSASKIALILTHSNLESNTNNNVMILKVMQILMSKVKFFDDVYVIGIFQTGIKHGYIRLLVYQTLLDQVLRYYSKKVQHYSWEGHAKFLQFCCNIPNEATFDYCKAIVNHMYKLRIIAFHRMLIYRRLVSTNYNFEHIDIRNMIKMFIKSQSQSAQGAYLILLLEKFMDQKVKQQLIVEIYETISKEIQKNPNFQIKSTVYQQLSKKLSDYSLQINIPQNQIIPHVFVDKPNEKNQFLLIKIAKIKKLNFEEYYFQSNYLPILGDKLFVFLKFSENGAFLKHKYYKKIIESKLKKSFDFVFIQQNFNLSQKLILTFAQKQYPLWISQSQLRQIKEWIDNLYKNQ